MGLSDCLGATVVCHLQLCFLRGVLNHVSSVFSQDRQTKVRAQRKFASSSQLELLNLTPVKQNSSSQSLKILNINGKTEHFLTFLCLRRKSESLVLCPQNT